MLRFDSKKAFYLYPESGENESKILVLNSGSTYENNVKSREDICLKKQGLVIANTASNYEEFREIMGKHEAAFTNQINSDDTWQQAM